MSKGKGLVEEFKKFIMRGNVMDMAVGVIVGGAFTSIVTSLNKDIVIDYSNLDNKKASDFYAYTYETDEETTYPNYSKLFENPYIVEGYVNSYLKDGKEYIVLEDNYNENYYSTYQNAKDAKSIFFVNENYIKITSSNSQFCPIYEHLELGSKLKVVVFPYLWNTQKYPQVYCYSFNVIDNNILN